MFHQSQLFKLRKHTSSETKFALYITAISSKGHNKIYYLKPESGAIVAEESSSPDGYYYYFIKRNTDHHQLSYTSSTLSADALTTTGQNSEVSHFL